MRITTWNVNGLRAAIRKGFSDHLDALGPDILLLQEVRATPDQLGADAAPPGWHVVWHPAERKGYSGVAVWSRKPISVLGVGMDDADEEGRILRVQVGRWQVVSAYLPSGSASPERQEAKEAWMARFRPWAAQLAARDEPVVIGGDLNIAHTEDDLFNPRGNKRNSGFLPQERAWFSELLAEGWTDLYRAHRGPGPGPWSWWSNRGRARELDRGWRIDYLLGNRAAASRLKAANIRREGGLSVSDHAPVSVDFKR